MTSGQKNLLKGSSFLLKKDDTALFFGKNESTVKLLHLRSNWP